MGRVLLGQQEEMVVHIPYPNVWLHSKVSLMTTPRDIRDYIHLYLGCNVVLDPGTATESTERMTGILMSAFIGEDNQLFAQVEMKTLVSTSHRNHPVSRIKLILRPLSSMTEEEMNEIDCDKRGKKTFFTEAYYESGWIEIEDAAKRVNYLRSRRIDCDGLISAGLAVEQKQVGV